jgi:hypothetical protein
MSQKLMKTACPEKKHFRRLIAVVLAIEPYASSNPLTTNDCCFLSDMPEWVRLIGSVEICALCKRDNRFPRLGCNFSYFFTSNAIPHFGHFPGPFCMTSGCIEQVYCFVESASLGGLLHPTNVIDTPSVATVTIKTAINLFIKNEPGVHLGTLRRKGPKVGYSRLFHGSDLKLLGIFAPLRVEIRVFSRGNRARGMHDIKTFLR